MERMETNKKIVAVMVGLGACARLVPHPWNFTPMMAIGLFAGAKSAKLRTGVFATIAALLLSDAILGFYRGMWYVYAASLIPVLIGSFAVRKREGVSAIAAAAFTSSLCFFLTTNFMVWAGGHMYPHTAAGLAGCYAAGIPFYQNQLLGDAFYTVALFGGHALVSRLMQRAPQVA
jgi:hypothetical protein